MVTQVEQTPVQLAGRGYAHRPAGKYQPGEYEILDNVDISLDGTLCQRRGFSWYRQLLADTVSDFFDNHRRFIGHYATYPLISTRDDKIYLGYNDNTNLETLFEQQSLDLTTTILSPIQAAGTALPGGYTVTNYSIGYEGYWFYNGFSHFLIEYRDYADNGGGSGTRIYRRRLALYRVQKDYTLTYVNPHNVLNDLSDNGSAAVTTLIEQSISAAGGKGFFTEPSPTFYVKNHLIHKDRAWVATKDTVYFSEAGDHSVWAPPDGGFIKFPNEEIKQIYALGDIIYVFCDAKIYAITYNTDFNTDGEVIVISAELGAESACAVGDTIYFYKAGSIYGVSGTNVSKVLDTLLPIPYSIDDLVGNYTHDVKIGAFDNELYLFMRMTRGTSLGLTGGTVGWYHDTYYDPKLFTGELNDTHLYKINLDSGFTSRVNLAPSVAKLWGQATARMDPVDMFFLPVESNTNQSQLFILNKIDVAGASGFCLVYPGAKNISGSGGSVLNEPNCDSVVSNTIATIGVINPLIKIKIKDFTPDGLKYMFKRFRSIMIEANIPRKNTEDLKLRFYYGDSAVAVERTMVENLSAGIYDSNPYRYAMNQRARYVTIELERLAQVFASSARDSLFDISDIRVLWTPTNRAPVDNSSVTS